MSEAKEGECRRSRVAELAKRKETPWYVIVLLGLGNVFSGSYALEGQERLQIEVTLSESKDAAIQVMGHALYRTAAECGLVSE